MCYRELKQCEIVTSALYTNATEFEQTMHYNWPECVSSQCARVIIIAWPLSSTSVRWFGRVPIYKLSMIVTSLRLSSSNCSLLICGLVCCCWSLALFSHCEPSPNGLSIEWFERDHGKQDKVLIYAYLFYLIWTNPFGRILFDRADLNSKLSLSIRVNIKRFDPVCRLYIHRLKLFERSLA